MLTNKNSTTIFLTKHHMQELTENDLNNDFSTFYKGKMTGTPMLYLMKLHPII